MTEAIEIMTADGGLRFATPVNVGSKRIKTLGGDNSVTLRFSVWEPVPFAVGDYADIPNEGRFFIASTPSPTPAEAAGGYSYELRLVAPEIFWNNKILKLNPGTLPETSFKMTDTISGHIQMVLRCLNYHGFTHHTTEGDIPYTFEVSEDVTAESRLVDYSGIKIYDAIKQIADTFECEVWLDGGVIRLGYCESGEIMTLERDVNVTGIKASGKTEGIPNRIYALGGTDNIPPYYRKQFVMEVTRKEGSDFFDDNHRLSTGMFQSGHLVEDPDSARQLTFSGSASYKTPIDAGKTVLVAQDRTTKTLSGGTWRLNLAKFKPVVTFKTSLVPQNACLYFRLIAKWTDTNETNELLRNKEVVFTDSQFSLPTFDSDHPYTPMWSEGIISLSAEYEVEFTLEVRFAPTEADFTGQIDTNNNCTLYFSSPSSHLSVERLTLVKLNGTIIPGVAFNLKHKPEYGSMPFTLPQGSEDAIQVGDRFLLPDLARNNIPPAWYTDEEGNSNTLGLTENRLRLPGKVPYINTNATVDDINAIEHIEIFEDVFPDQEHKITNVFHDVREVAEGDGAYSQYYVYYFETNYKYSPSFRISDTELKVKFTSGLLNGMTFVVNWHFQGTYDNEYRPCFEIVLNEDYGPRLPNATLHPDNGDEFILLGWADDTIYEELISKAEQKLLEKVTDWAEKAATDGQTFDCPMIPQVSRDNGIPVMGQRVCLKEPALFPTGEFVTRVLKVEYPLDIPFDNPLLTCGDMLPQKRLQGIQKQIEALGKLSDMNAGSTGEIPGTLVVADLDNQSDAIVFDDLGNIIGGLPQTSVRVYANGKEITDFSILASCDCPGIGVTVSGAKVQITSADISMPDKVQIIVNVVVNGIQTASNISKLTFTIIKQRGDCKYQLMLSDTSIKRLANGTFVPTASDFKAGVIMLANDTPRLLTIAEQNRIGLKLSWRTDSAEDFSVTLPELDANTQWLQCRLMRQTDEGEICIDLETIHIIEDGKSDIHVDNGNWMAGTDYQNNDTRIDDVWYNGQKWRCEVAHEADDTNHPGVTSTLWMWIEGDPDLHVDFAETDQLFGYDDINIPLTLVVRYHGEDITDLVADADVEWSRYSENAKGEQRVLSDEYWNDINASRGKAIVLTEADVQTKISEGVGIVRFTATVVFTDPRSGRRMRVSRSF